MTPRTMHPFLVALLAGILAGAFATSAGASDAADSPAIHYRDGHVTVRAAGAPRGDVVAALAREAGIAVRGDVLDTRPVYKSFTDVALGDALDRLLGKQNFLLVYDDAGRPTRLELLGLEEPKPPPAPGRARPLPPRVVRAAPAPQQVSHALGAPRPVFPRRR